MQPTRATVASKVIVNIRANITNPRAGSLSTSTARAVRCSAARGTTTVQRFGSPLGTRLPPVSIGGRRILIPQVTRASSVVLQADEPRLDGKVSRLPQGSVERCSGVERVLAFTDLVGSTALNVVTGDAEFLDLLREHHDVVGHCVRRFEGDCFHNTGDGFGLAFTTVGDAVRCATAIHHALAEVSARHPSRPLRVRIGIAAGRPLALQGDLYGIDVVRAVRVCAIANEGETLLSEEIAPLHLHGFRLEPNSTIVLKGFTQPTATYRLIEA